MTSPNSNSPLQNSFRPYPICSAPEIVLLLHNEHFQLIKPNNHSPQNQEHGNGIQESDKQKSTRASSINRKRKTVDLDHSYQAKRVSVEDTSSASDVSQDTDTVKYASQHILPTFDNNLSDCTSTTSCKSRSLCFDYI